MFAGHPHQKNYHIGRLLKWLILTHVSCEAANSSGPSYYGSKGGSRAKQTTDVHPGSLFVSGMEVKLNNEVF